MQTIADACGCHGRQSDSRDRGLISSLPIPYCTLFSMWISSTAYPASVAMIAA